MAAEPEAVEFTLADRSKLDEVVRRLGERRDGWLNLQAVPDDGEPDERKGRAGLFAVFSGKGPDLPIGTYVPGEMTRKGLTPDSLGLQHAGGPKARFKLAEDGFGVPTGWKILADHPKRGLVVELPIGTDPVEALDWLLLAAVDLAPVELPEHWTALVYRR